MINVWASYAMSGFTFAGEYNKGDFDADGKADGYLLMANYATGPLGVTAALPRLSRPRTTRASPPARTRSSPSSPSYKVGNNLLLVAEFRMDDFSRRRRFKLFALEALFTF